MFAIQSSVCVRSGAALLIVASTLPGVSAGAAGRAGSSPISWNEALDRDPEWYDSDEAVRIADNALLYQHASGGWPKSIDVTQVLTEDDRARIRRDREDSDTEVGRPTLDNGATCPEMRYLAHVYHATGRDRFKEGFLRGLDYLLEAQYDNGGWPQFYPIREGYYQRITFNDGAMIQVMRLLREVAEGEASYEFVDEKRRRRVETALDKGLDAILKMQIEVDGKLTGWCAQHDENDFSPAGARSYEHPSISGHESVGIVRYLMEIEDPEPEVIRAVESAVAWFDEARIENTRMVDAEVDGRRDRIVREDPDYGSTWARFYEIGTNRPIFSGRDGVIKYDLAKIERERRVGYRWLGTWPRGLLENEYPRWRERWVNG